MVNSDERKYFCFSQDVRNIILDICKNDGGMDDKEAETFVKKLESQKRYSADVWS